MFEPSIKFIPLAGMSVRAACERALYLAQHHGTKILWDCRGVCMTTTQTSDVQDQVERVYENCLELQRKARKP